MADMRATTSSAPLSTDSISGGQIAERALAEAKGIGNELLSAVRDSANSLFEEQRDAAAKHIAAVGQALQSSAQSLGQTGGGPLAGYAGTAAQQVNDFATRLRQRSWSQLTADLEAFARQWPGVFIAAAIGGGFLAGRFAISSGARGYTQSAASPPAPLMAETGPGVASHDYGAIGNPTSGIAKTGYGADAARETG